MTLQDYARGLGERGLLIVKDRAFGQMNGYPYFIYPNWRGSVIHSLAAVFHFSQNVRPRYLKNQVPDTKLTSGTNPGTLTMTVKVDKLDDGKDSLNRFFQKMGEFTDAAHKMGLTAPGKCPICKQGNCDSLALFPQGYVPTHRACVEQSNFDRIRDAADNSEHGNHGLGILGAFLGAMLGCLLVFLIAMFSGIIYAVLYVVIPLASYYGYKLFKGRMDKTALTSVLIFSILSLFAFEFANFAVVWHRQIGEWLSPAGLFSRYFQIMSGSAMLSDMAMPALFLFFGILLDWNTIKSSNKTYVQNAENQLQTLMVLDPQAPAVPGSEVEKASRNAAAVEGRDSLERFGSAGEGEVLGDDIARQSGKQSFSEALKEYQQQKSQEDSRRKEPPENPQNNDTFDVK